MKIQNKTKSLNIFIILAVISIFFMERTFAQMHINSSFYISTNGNLFVNNGVVTLGSNAQVSTTKTSSYTISDGKMILGNSSSITTDGSKYVDGYLETRSTVNTLLAIGAGLIYAPIKVTPVSGTGVHAAYFSATPLSVFSNNLDLSVTAVANTEYWIIKGADAIVSLSWRVSSGLSSYPFADVTIVGYKNGKWEAIPSLIDITSVFGGASVLNGTGSITSTNAIPLSTYDAFAIGRKGVSCAELIASSGTTKTWNGSWSPSAPTLADPVVISAPYSAGSFACNSITLNANVTLTGSQSLEIVHGVSGTGKVIMSSEASLVQRDKNATAPVIELTKTTRPMKRFDYVYWGAPITADAFTQLNNAQAAGATLANAFDAKYKYVAGNTTASGGWQPLTVTTPGNGFITRVKEQAPYTTASATATIDVKFDGTANNGDVTVPVSFVNGTPTSARNNNLLANPYPSAIDADKFLTENSSLLDGVIYLWKAQTTNDGVAQAYTNADYIAYTKAGTTAASGTGTDNTFSGKIASGQGFKVKALGAGNVLFTNCMRVVGNNSQFYRINDYATNSSETVDRYKVNLQTSSGIANQVLVAYLPQASLAYDYMYDAELYSVSPTKMYTVLDDNNDAKKLAINARPSFENTDEVTIGFTKETDMSSQMSFNVVEKEGLFNSNQTPIYLYDSQLNVYHNFINGPYTFTTNEIENTSRFKIVYQANVLNNPDFNNFNLIGQIKTKNLHISTNVEMEQVQIYDLTGRLVERYDDIEEKVLLKQFNHEDGIYLAKIKLTNGVWLTHKLITQN